ncbi:hypothetical protein [Tenacibaculum maritimum]|uniref:hypothetical protein n=1 Tax=Tenacibaculum maritimum TaxID=107401 RepID=UPI00387711BB
MKITQKNNGNILIQNLQNKFIALMPKVFVFPHPRKQNAIILNGTGIYGDDINSIEGSLDQGIYVNGNRFSNLNSLINEIQKEVVLNGNRSSISTDMLQEQNINRAMFESITDYETMYQFTKEHSKTAIPLKTDASGKINKEEYLLQLNDLVARITLTYYYLYEDKISHILMSGSTGNIALPLKTYMYGDNNEITHTYELSTWQRLINTN